VTVDTYGHLIRGADIAFVDRLDQVLPEPEKTTPQQSATNPQQAGADGAPYLMQIIDEIGGGAWTWNHGPTDYENLAGICSVMKIFYSI
jgi:hypothetical protein